jgi:5-formyltetrahydrofolate cyclo-ligase
MLKAEVRKNLLDQRKSLTENECIKLDDLLLIQLQKLDWSATFHLGSFYPLENVAEPNTLLMTKYLKYALPEMQLYYPIVNEQDYSMNFYQETETLQVNKWGIQEPLPFNFIAPHSLDTLLVPLVGFDQQGQRIGFGKGYYDRYFARCDKNVERIGISYFEPVAIIEDTHEFDVPLTHCITPWNCYEF